MVYGRLGNKTIERQDVWATRAGWLDIIGRQSISIINTVIRQVMCKCRADIIQQNPYALPRSLVLFGNQGLRLCTLNTHSLNYTGAAAHITWMKTVKNDMDSNKFTWTEAVNLAQNRPLWRLFVTVISTSF